MGFFAFTTILLLFFATVLTYGSGEGFAQVGSTLFGIPRVDPFAPTQFGSFVSVSKDGLSLVVGAKGYDNSPDGVGNGGVFLYEWDTVSADWILASLLTGSEGEGILEASISADGSRVAIVRLNRPDGNQYVEVYDSASGIKLGSSLFTGGSGGRSSLSGNGMVVAIASANHGANVGRVETFQWNAAISDWNWMASIDGIEFNSLFGWALDLSQDGFRLAVAAPLQSQYGFMRNGVCKIFDWGEGVAMWIQAAEFGGHEDSARFGLSVGLSSDGSTLVVGAPTGASTARVNVYQHDGVSGSWTSKGLIEDSSGNQIGRSVSIDGTGSRIAVSWGNTGLMRLFAWDDDSLAWMPATQSIYGEKFALADNGVRLAVANSNGVDGNGLPIGYVRVLDQHFVPSALPYKNPTTAPSAAPIISGSMVPTSPGPTSPSLTGSLAPSISLSVVPTTNPGAEVPSTSPPVAVITSAAQSKAPSSSPVPTYSFTSQVPTVVGVFDWVLERTNAIIIAFDDNNSRNEVQLSYTTSHRNVWVQVFENDCMTVVPLTLINATFTQRIATAQTSTLDIFLDIQQDSIQGSSLWTNEGSNSGRINLCVRTDLLLLNHTSVHFHEQRLKILIGLSQGFSISAIDLDRTAPNQESLSVSANYNITSCQCDANYDCISESAPAIVQGSNVLICIETLSLGVEIGGVEELDFTQGALSIAAVHNRSWNDLTECYLLGTKAVCRSQLQSAFFSGTSPQDVVASGVISLRFSDNNRKLLFRRSLQGDQNETSSRADFQVTMSLAGKQREGEGMSVRMVIGLVVGLTAAALAASILLFAMAFRKSKVGHEANGLPIAV